MAHRVWVTRGWCAASLSSSQRICHLAGHFLRVNVNCVNLYLRIQCSAAASGACHASTNLPLILLLDMQR